MKEYNPVTAEVIDALKAVVGDKYVKTDADVLDVYKSDESLAPSFWKTPEVVVLPANTQEVSEIMKVANRFDVPVTPRSAVPASAAAPSRLIRASFCSWNG